MERVEGARVERGGGAIPIANCQVSLSVSSYDTRGLWTLTQLIQVVVKVTPIQYGQYTPKTQRGSRRGVGENGRGGQTRQFCPKASATYLSPTFHSTEYLQVLYPRKS